VTLTLPLSLGKGRGDRRSRSHSGNSFGPSRKAGTQENPEVDRLVPKPMAADPTQRVGDNAFHLPVFLIQNLSREDPNVETLHLFSTE
jgi:hypothetical protein